MHHPGIAPGPDCTYAHCKWQCFRGMRRWGRGSRATGTCRARGAPGARCPQARLLHPAKNGSTCSQQIRWHPAARGKRLQHDYHQLVVGEDTSLGSKGCDVERHVPAGGPAACIATCCATGSGRTASGIGRTCQQGRSHRGRERCHAEGLIRICEKIEDHCVQHAHDRRGHGGEGSKAPLRWPGDGVRQSESRDKQQKMCGDGDDVMFQTTGHELHWLWQVGGLEGMRGL
jgi:hypothetical protein